MKIRCQFVSNSSSSSFVLLTTQENYNNTYAQLDDERRIIFDVLEAACHIDKMHKWGQNLVKLSFMTGERGVAYNTCFKTLIEAYELDIGELVFEDIKDRIEDVGREFIKMAQKDAANTFVYSDYF